MTNVARARLKRHFCYGSPIGKRVVELVKIQCSLSQRTRRDVKVQDDAKILGENALGCRHTYSNVIPNYYQDGTGFYVIFVPW